MKEPAGMTLIRCVEAWYGESETQARRRIFDNGEAWKREALQRIAAGKDTAGKLFDPADHWETKPEVAE